MSIIGTAVACGNERNDKLFKYGALHDLLG